MKATGDKAAREFKKLVRQFGCSIKAYEFLLKQNGNKECSCCDLSERLQPVMESWKRYKDDMRPETRNEFLRAFMVFSNEAI